MAAPEIGEIPLGTKVIVAWFDAWGDQDTMPRHEWKSALPVETVGWLERDNEDVISLAAERFPEDPDTFRGVTHIPRSIVQSVKALR